MNRFCFAALLLGTAALLGLASPASAGQQPVALTGTGVGQVGPSSTFTWSGSLQGSPFGTATFAGNSRVTGPDLVTVGNSLVTGLVTFNAGNGNTLTATIVGSANGKTGAAG